VGGGWGTAAAAGGAVSAVAAEPGLAAASESRVAGDFTWGVAVACVAAGGVGADACLRVSVGDVPASAAAEGGCGDDAAPGWKPLWLAAFAAASAGGAIFLPRICSTSRTSCLVCSGSA
jgi:hypothetical protein